MDARVHFSHHWKMREYGLHRADMKTNTFTEKSLKQAHILLKRELFSLQISMKPLGRLFTGTQEIKILIYTRQLSER